MPLVTDSMLAAFEAFLMTTNNRKALCIALEGLLVSDACVAIPEAVSLVAAGTAFNAFTEALGAPVGHRYDLSPPQTEQEAFLALPEAFLQNRCYLFPDLTVQAGC